MRLKFVIFSLFLLSVVHADDVFFAAKNVKQEIGQKNYVQEYKIFAPYEKRVSYVQKLEKDAYKKNNNDRLMALDKLIEYQKQSKSLILSQLIIDQSLKYINIRDVKKFKKYIKPSADVLYKRGLCDGYLFEGVFSQYIEGNKLKALRIYENGVKSCSIGWKKMSIMSRLSKLKYKLGLIKKQ